jgi:hypothetical protein
VPRRARAGILGWQLVPLAAAVALVTWVRVLPLSLAGAEDPEFFRHRGTDGREHAYLGDYDSYLWVRHARNLLRTGSECEAIEDGECRDTLAHAPVGRRMRYTGSLHVAAVAGLHRVLDRLRPGYPLTATAYWVPVLAGALGAVAAFALGRRLAGPLGGLVAAVASGVNPLFLHRSVGSDNDVWNVVLPLCAVSAIAAAVTTRRGEGRRAALALLAAAVMVLHALTWRGWVLVYAAVLSGLALHVLLAALRILRSRGRRAPAERRALGRALLAAGVFLAAATFGSIAAGTDQTPLTLPAAVLATLRPAPASPPVPERLWPSAFETVGELIRPDLPWIAAAMGGDLRFFAGWLGLLLLVLPRRRWRWWHFAVLVGGNFLYRWLLVHGSGTRGTLVLLLALPIVAGAAGWVAARRADRDAAAGLAVVVWFLAALFLAFGGQRYVMLLVPAFGVVLGVAVGRFHLWLSDLAGRAAGPRARPWVPPVVFALVALALVPPLRDGRAAAREYLPRMHDAWWDGLTRIRDETPPDTIVNTWWDFGHWVTAIAERRTSADGASLATHVPHWLARALLAPSEEETLGLLRMLNCGSDATPEPEGARGAHGKLVARGLDHVAAYETVAALARLDRAGARAHLAARGLGPAGAEDVLASTHCTPPPALLVLPSSLARTGGWWTLGTWDLRRAYAAEISRHRPEAEAVADLDARFGLGEGAALALWREARRLRDAAAARRFAASALGYLVPDWLACAPAAAGGWECPAGVPTGTGAILDAVVFHPEAPLRAPLVVRRGPGRESATPEALIVAGAGGRREVVFPRAAFPGLAVLVDEPGRRVLLGTPHVLRSTFTQLVFLNGRHLRHLEPFDARTGPAGDRVLAWWIRDGDLDRPMRAPGGDGPHAGRSGEPG